MTTPSCVPSCANYSNSEPDLKFQEKQNGRDAIEKAERLKPDLIILDLFMPVMTGLDAAPLLRKLLPNARIILFTVQEGAKLNG